jgi:hypothetical protein
MIDPNAQPPWASDDIPTVLTYVYPPPDGFEPRFQLQWDYQVEWPRAGRPTITLLKFRSFQQMTSGGKAELVEEIAEDIPVTEMLMMQLSTHAAGYLYANSVLDGAWRFADRTFLSGSEEAAKKRFSLTAFRQLAQAAPNPGADRPTEADRADRDNVK